MNLGWDGASGLTHTDIAAIDQALCAAALAAGRVMQPRVARVAPARRQVVRQRAQTIQPSRQRAHMRQEAPQQTLAADAAQPQPRRIRGPAREVLAAAAQLQNFSSTASRDELLAELERLRIESTNLRNDSDRMKAARQHSRSFASRKQQIFHRTRRSRRAAWRHVGALKREQKALRHKVLEAANPFTVVRLKADKRRRGLRSRLTTRGRYSLATRRQFAHASAYAVSAALDAGVSQWSVRRCEILMSEAIVVRSRSLSHENYQWLDYQRRQLSRSFEKGDSTLALAWDQNRRFSWDVMSIRCDATNGQANVSSGAKGFMTEVRHLFHHNIRMPKAWPADEEHPPEEPSCVYEEILADVMQCPDRCGGLACRAMLVKQLESLGKRPWTFRHESDTELERNSKDNPDVSIGHIQVAVAGSDAGPDQVGCDDLMTKDFA